MAATSFTPCSAISQVSADGIATVALNRPEARNGYTPAMSDELEHAFKAADAEASVSAVVFTSMDPDFFVAADLSGCGFDLSINDDGGEGWQEPARRCSKTIFGLNKLVVAALRGVAVGGGLTIALSCDFRLASHDSRFAFPFSRRGVFPEGGSIWHLRRLVGVLRAACVLARDIIANTSSGSTAVTKQMLNQLNSLDSPLPAHALDSQPIAEIPSHGDAVEGALSFLEKRPPHFPVSVPAEVPQWLPWLDGNEAP